MWEMAYVPREVQADYRRVRKDMEFDYREIGTLSDYFRLFGPAMIPDSGVFWFRGLGDFHWDLTPSALRFKKQADRDHALRLLAEFKRCAEIQLSRPPEPTDHLAWVQLAQHYGLPTRLLDWTENAAAALYFACVSEPGTDGFVCVLKPEDLNRQAVGDPRILDVERDAALIAKYLALKGGVNRRGRKTVAIQPVWNSQRIMLQRGVFTLHGSKDFRLDKRQVPSLMAVPVLAKHKQDLRLELERVGVTEMALFPELEHVCSHLKRNLPPT